jgi:hypothetical protein
MVVIVILTAAGLAARVKGVPAMELVLGLLAVTFTDAFDFAVLAGFAYALRRDAAAHKRFIIIETAGLTRAAFFRWHVPMLFHQVYRAYAATYVFLVLLAAYDLWSTRNIHRATMWGSLFLIVTGQLTRFIGPSAPWHAFAHWVQSLGRIKIAEASEMVVRKAPAGRPSQRLRGGHAHWLLSVPSL